MNVFTNYSKYYNLIYKDKNYELESDYISSLLKKYNPKTKTILELGCGTGRHAYLLMQKCYSVFGIDLSATMLEQAKSLGVDCEIGDVRTFRAGRKFDAALSLFHILSYQTTDDDVLNFFETAAEHLYADGVLIFDIWYKDAVLSQLPEKRIKELENEEIKVKRFCNPEHFKEKSLVLVNYDIEITDKKTNKVEVVKETHPMRYFSLDEIKSFALQKGFDIILTQEWLTGEIPSKKTWGVCFVGVRK